MIEWIDAYGTGNERIDREHQRLIACINELEFAVECGETQEAVATAVDFLSRYARWHFAGEEACMMRAKCPTHAANCAAHNAFNERIDSWVARLSKGASPTIAGEIHNEASHWIQQHILKIDSKLRDCVYD